MTNISQPEAKTTSRITDDEKGSTNSTSVTENDLGDGSDNSTQAPPLRWKLMAIVLITAISFGSQWSSGITSAMKSTIKKELKVNNKQFALLEASEDFMVTVLMLLSGIVTDRIGGASKKQPICDPYSHLKLIRE